MGRAPFPHLVALACGFLAAAAIGCGGDRSHLIPSSDASSLTEQLDTMKSAIAAGECDGLSARVERFHDDATGLDGSVDSRLRKRINDGVKSLEAHALEDCREAAAAQTETTETTTTETDTTETETVPTDTTTTTVPTDTTPTTTPTETTTVPPETTTTPPADTTTEPQADPDAGTDNGGTPGEEIVP